MWRAVLVCRVQIDTGEILEPEKVNRLIEAIADCFKGQGISVVYAHHVLDLAKKEVSRRAILK